MQSSSENIRASLRSFFEAAAVDLEVTVDHLSVTLAAVPRGRGPGPQHQRGLATVCGYTASTLLPILTALSQHLSSHSSGEDLLGRAATNDYFHSPFILRRCLTFACFF